MIAGRGHREQDSPVPDTFIRTCASDGMLQHPAGHPPVAATTPTGGPSSRRPQIVPPLAASGVARCFQDPSTDMAYDPMMYFPGNSDDLSDSETSSAGQWPPDAAARGAAELNAYRRGYHHYGGAAGSNGTAAAAAAAAAAMASEPAAARWWAQQRRRQDPHEAPWPWLPPAWLQYMSVSGSDSYLAQRGQRVHFASLPAVLALGPQRSASSSLGRSREPRLRLSQARLIIPRSVSEYFDLCRYVRSHSEGLLLASSIPAEELASCRDVAPRALSEGLLGGRLYAAIHRGERQRRPGDAGAPKPARTIPVEELKEGTIVEGKILRSSDIGFFMDIGAEKPGLLRRHHCRGVPRRLLQRGEFLSNLVVLRVDKKRRRFTLGIGRIDGLAHLEEVAYAEVLQRIGGWAGVEVPPPGSEERRMIGDEEDEEEEPPAVRSRSEPAVVHREAAVPRVPPLDMPL